MKLQVLGPVAAMDRETQVALGGPRQRAVLAVLVAFVNNTVSTDRLIDEVWGADPPAAARNSLQSMVSNLRKALKPDPRISIDGEGRGYVLRAPVDAVDSLEFAAMFDEARGLIGSDVDAGVRQLYGALELWRGAPYGDLADEIDVLRTETTRLEELRIRVLEYRIEGELTTGNPADLVGELESLIEAHPLREGLSRLLMVALARSGRQAEALRVASGLRRVLAAEIGIEPSTELVRLEQEILDQSVEAPAPAVTDNPYRGLEAFTEKPAELESARADNSIAVLPFVNMSSDEEQEYFSDGLSEELLNLLARIPELKVAARTSSFSFKGKDLGVPEIASQLGVAHVLEGGVRKHGNQLRITAQLIQAGNGYHLWSERYDRQLDNVFQIQEDIAISVVAALRITLIGGAPKTRKTDPRAYQLFLEGQYLKRQFSHDSLNRAVEAFKQAVEIDPTYVPAWAELADTYLWDGGSDELSREKRVALADQAIQTAISTDPDCAFAHYVRGISWFFSKHRFKQGIEDFEHALELDPDDAFIVAAIGKGAFLTGQYDFAIAQYQAALAMEPVVPEFYWFLGKAYLSSGRFEDAEASFRKLSSLSPSYSGDFGLFEALLLKGDLEAALAESDTDLKRAIAHFAAGNTAKADEALAGLVENEGPYSIAMVYGYRGEIDKTFEWLDSLLGRSDYYPTWILTETAFRSIHSDPRWESLLEKLGLVEFWLEMTPDYRPL